MGQRNGLWLLAFGLALTILVVYLFQRFPGAVDLGERPDFVYTLLLLALVGSSMLLRIRSRPLVALRQAAVWVAIGLVLVIGYSYRDLFGDLRARIGGELMPSQGQAVGADGVTFRARDDGHFHVEAMIDGQRVLFMVDTGASDVVLTAADAERLGFDTRNLAYSRRYATANGTVWGAPVKLDEISIGPIRIGNVDASVNRSDMDQSLLGMSFLRRLGAYEVRGDQLTLWR